MSNRTVYIDYNATTPISDEVKAVLIEGMEVFGNASSMHASGREAKARVEEARAAVSVLLGAAPEEIIFTSGGSESNNTVFTSMGLLASGRKKLPAFEGRNQIITTAIEHPCIMNTAQYLLDSGLDVTMLPVDAYGKVDLATLKNALSDKTLFVSVMAANNEIGTIQDIKKISGLAKEAGALVHTDSTQAIGKIPVNVNDMGVDYLTMSGHKIYGPKGIGALYARKGAPLFPLIHGGHQENGYRAGTYNNLGIIGLGKAVELALQKLPEYGKKMTALRLRLKDGLLAKIPNIHINGHPDDVLSNTLSVSFPGAEGEAILLSMDMEGIEASTGSACASGSLEPSHVLMATGAGPELAHGSIRFSMGWGIGEEDIDYIIEKLPPIIKRLRDISSIA